jgi:hypothetical protein
MGEHLTQFYVLVSTPREMRCIVAKQTVQVDPALIVELYDQGKPNKKQRPPSRAVPVATFAFKSITRILIGFSHQGIGVDLELRDREVLMFANLEGWNHVFGNAPAHQI